VTSRHEIGGNSEHTLPADKAEASKVLYNRLVKLSADRRAYGDTARDMLKDAKAETKIAPRIVRLGYRLNRLTPEKREKWAEEMSAAAKLFGFSKLDVANPEREGPLWNLVQTLATIEDERREISDHIRGLVKFAKSRGDLDVRSIQKLASMARKPKDELADEWADLDTMATFLGLW